MRAKKISFPAWLKWAIPAAGIALAAFLLARALGRYSLGELRSAIIAVPGHRIALAIGFAGASYFCLTLFDALGLRYARHPLPYWKAAWASFTALSLGHTIGLAALSSGAVRYRFYTRWGLSAEQVAKLILFCAVTVGLGLMVLAGLAFVARPQAVQHLTGISHQAVVTVGIACLLVPLVYLMLTAMARGQWPPLRVFSWSFEWPPPGLALAQLIVGPLNFALVAACLHQTLAAAREISYADAAIIYAMANTATIFSHAPGGVGVIEWVVTSLLPGAQIAGAVLVFRFVYYLLPLCLGGISLAASELLLKEPRRAVPLPSD